MPHLDVVGSPGPLERRVVLCYQVEVFAESYHRVNHQVLGSYLLQRGPSFLKNKIVLELGSGTGLVGLVAGYLGSEHVWITDQRSVRLLPPSSCSCLFTFISEHGACDSYAHSYCDRVPSTTSPLLDIMRQNVQLNSLSSTVTVAELNWCFALFLPFLSCGRE